MKAVKISVFRRFYLYYANNGEGDAAKFFMSAQNKIHYETYCRFYFLAGCYLFSGREMYW